VQATLPTPPTVSPVLLLAIALFVAMVLGALIVLRRKKKDSA
jgi:LPXTG-motif cell wall-anchored protein